MKITYLTFCSFIFIFVFIYSCGDPSYNSSVTSTEEMRSEKIRTDSFNYYLSKSQKFYESNKNDSFLLMLHEANRFVRQQSETFQIQSFSDSVYFDEANELIKKKKYKSALPVLDTSS